MQHISDTSLIALRLSTSPCRLRPARAARRLVRYRWQRAVEIQVDVYVFQRRGQRSKQFVGYRIEEQALHELDVSRRRLCNGFAARGGQPCIGGSAVAGRGLTVGQATLAHTPQVMQYAATLPADLGGQVGNSHPRVWRVAQCDEYMVIGQ